MSLLPAFFLLPIVLIALDLLTAPKYAETPHRARLKESRRAA